jgi:hypothetical protein
MSHPTRILFACGALLTSSTPLKDPDAPLCVWCNQPKLAHADLPPEEQGGPIDHPLRPDGEKARCLFGCETDTDKSGRKHHRCLADDGTAYFVVTCKPVEVMNATA